MNIGLHIKIITGSFRRTMERHSLKKIIKLLSTKKISEEELVKYYYSRIEKHNPTLNAVVSLRNIGEVFDSLISLKRYPSKKKERYWAFLLP